MSSIDAKTIAVAVVINLLVMAATSWLLKRSPELRRLVGSGDCGCN